MLCTPTGRPFRLAVGFSVGCLGVLVLALVLQTHALVLTPGGTAERVAVGFCNSDGSGFFNTQPADQLERWRLPHDNGTHLVVDWTADNRVCGRNVSSYLVDIRTSTPLLNMFVAMFGRFPQDVCDPRSVARGAVELEDAQTSTCSPYETFCAHKARQSSFEIPGVLLQVAQWDVEVTVRAYGSHAPVNRAQEAIPCTWWCHKYRRLPLPGERPARPWNALGRLLRLPFRVFKRPG